MDTQATEKAESKRLSKLKSLAVLSLVLFGLLPGLTKMLGYNFLPSIEWMEKIRLTAFVTSLVSVALLFWVALQRVQEVQGSTMKRVGIVICAPFLGYILATNIVVIAGPMALALVVGNEVALPFILEHTDRKGTRHCRSPLEVQGLPLFFNKVCSVSNDFRQTVAPGERIVAIGRGTSFGLFAERLRRD